MASFLDDLPGIRDLVNVNGVTVARRSTLEIDGVGVSLSDDSTAGVSTLAIDAFGSGATQTVSLTSGEDDVAFDDGVYIVRASADANGYVLSGFVALDTPLLLMNVGTHSVKIDNESSASAAANRVLTPGGTQYTWAAGEIIELIRDTTAGRWRLVRP